MADRGQYRGIRRVLLDGPDFQQLPAEARWVFVALKINLGPCGIEVEYPDALVARLASQTGHDIPCIAAALDELERGGWIMREANVIWVEGQLEHDPALKVSNPKHVASVRDHVKGLPRIGIVGLFLDKYRRWFDMESDPKWFDGLREKYPKGIEKAVQWLPNAYRMPTDGHADQKCDTRDTTEDRRAKSETEEHSASDEADASAARRTLEEEAVYLRLLWRQWREGSLPAERGDLEKLARGPVTPKVLECIPRCDDGRRRNRRVEEIRGQHLGTSEKRSAAGKNGRAKQLAQTETGAPPVGFVAHAGPGLGRAQAEPEPGPGRVRANAGQSESESDTEPDLKSLSASDEADASAARRTLAQDRAVLMGVVRTVCYAPDGKPREPHGDRTDADILTGWLRKGRSPDEIERAIRGVRLAIDQGELDFAKPNQKFGLKILNHTHSGARHVWEIALQAYDRAGVRESQKRSRSGVTSIADLIARKGA